MKLLLREMFAAENADARICERKRNIEGEGEREKRREERERESKRERCARFVHHRHGESSRGMRMMKGWKGRREKGT